MAPPYPLTAPAVRPETIRRWNRSTRIITGTVTTTAAAAMSPIGCAERLERRGAVDLRRLFELPRDLPEEGGQSVDGERQRERHVRDYQTGPGVAEADL
jgi:hypothetical protein